MIATGAMLPRISRSPPHKRARHRKEACEWPSLSGILYQVYCRERTLRVETGGSQPTKITAVDPQQTAPEVVRSQPSPLARKAREPGLFLQPGSTQLRTRQPEIAAPLAAALYHVSYR